MNLWYPNAGVGNRLTFIRRFQITRKEWLNSNHYRLGNDESSFVFVYTRTSKQLAIIMLLIRLLSASAAINLGQSKFFTTFQVLFSLLYIPKLENIHLCHKYTLIIKWRPKSISFTFFSNQTTKVCASKRWRKFQNLKIKIRRHCYLAVRFWYSFSFFFFFGDWFEFEINVVWISK